MEVCGLFVNKKINEKRTDFGVIERKQHQNFILCVKTFHTRKKPVILWKEPDPQHWQCAEQALFF